MLDHVVWIGGATAAGKTSVARRLARRHGLRLYSADTQTWAHRDRALAEGVAAAQRFEAIRGTETWHTVTDDEIAELGLPAERARMVVEDIAGLPHTPMVVAEVAPSPLRSSPQASRTHATRCG